MDAPGSTSLTSGLSRCALMGRAVSSAECCEIITTTRNSSDLAACRSCPEGVALMKTAKDWKKEAQAMPKPKKEKKQPKQPRGNCLCGKEGVKLCGNEEKGWWCFECFVKEPWKKPIIPPKDEPLELVFAGKPEDIPPPAGHMSTPDVLLCPECAYASHDSCLVRSEVTEAVSECARFAPASKMAAPAVGEISAAAIPPEGQLMGKLLDGLSPLQDLKTAGGNVEQVLSDLSQDSEPSWDEDFEPILSLAKSNELTVSIQAGDRLTLSVPLMASLGWKRGQLVLVRVSKDRKALGLRLAEGEYRRGVTYSLTSSSRCVCLALNCGQPLKAIAAKSGKYPASTTSWGFCVHLDKPIEYSKDIPSIMAGATKQCGKSPNSSKGKE